MANRVWKKTGWSQSELMWSRVGVCGALWSAAWQGVAWRRRWSVPQRIKLHKIQLFCVEDVANNFSGNWLSGFTLSKTLFRKQRHEMRRRFSCATSLDVNGIWYVYFVDHSHRCLSSCHLFFFFFFFSSSSTSFPFSIVFACFWVFFSMITSHHHLLWPFLIIIIAICSLSLWWNITCCPSFVRSSTHSCVSITLAAGPDPPCVSASVSLACLLLLLFTLTLIPLKFSCLLLVFISYLFHLPLSLRKEPKRYLTTLPSFLHEPIGLGLEMQNREYHTLRLDT